MSCSAEPSQISNPLLEPSCLGSNSDEMEPYEFNSLAKAESPSEKLNESNKKSNEDSAHSDAVPSTPAKKNSITEPAEIKKTSPSTIASTSSPQISNGKNDNKNQTPKAPLKKVNVGESFYIINCALEKCP